MKKVIIIAGNPIGYELAAAMHELIAEPIEIQQKQQNKVFSDEALRIKNYEPNIVALENYYEPKPSKFISKPKNNFKRR